MVMDREGERWSVREREIEKERQVRTRERETRNQLDRPVRDVGGLPDDTRAHQSK